MKKFFLTAGIILLIGVLGAMIYFYIFGFSSISGIVADQVLGHLPPLTVNEPVVATSTPAAPAVSESEVLKDFLGFNKAKTYLVLFLNNTELRPGGGFMGAYAVVGIDKARFSVRKVEGTEILDNYAPPFTAEPPAPLKKYVLVDRWNFRDANWSPDFARSSQKALELYGKERGLAAGEIDAVIGITPTIFEKLLVITGPLSVDGEEYTSQNFTEKLEYEVEYGYVKDGKKAIERKLILGDLGKVLEEKLKRDLFKNWSAYWSLARQLIQEKQLLVYSTEPDMQTKVAALGWSGQMRSFDGDYLLYADANLAALKTDASIRRTLTYTITPTTSQKFIAEVDMHYIHTHKIDWRTSRYRSYARIFVPLGSELIGVEGMVKNTPVDKGVEDGRAWFGTLVDVGALKEGHLKFRYYLAPTVVERLKQGEYALSVQKQLGTNGVGLTLGLNFGTPLLAARPGELPAFHGDSRYDLKTDLSVDRVFGVTLAN